MSNILTDQLRLASKIYASGFLLFEYPLRAIPDSHQVVFRGDQHRGSIGPHAQKEQQVKVRKGDIIIRVYLTPRVFALTGTIATKDKYKRVYEIPIELTVSDPEHVAREYFQEKDPAKQAIDLLKENVERYAASYEHDRIPNILPFASWIVAKVRETGIHVEQKGKTMFREDPQFTELFRLQNEAKNRQAMLKAEADIQRLQDHIKKEHEMTQKDYEFEVIAKQKDFDRQEDTKDQIHTICKNLREVAAKEITEVLRERIREGFERGRTPSQISDEYFALFGLFEDKFHVDMENGIIKSMFVDSSIEYDDDMHTLQTNNSPSSSAGPPDSTNQPETEPELEAVDLGQVKETDPSVS